MGNKIRVVVIDDHLVSRAGIVSLLARNPRIDVVAEGEAGNHVLDLVDAFRPDVLITDLLMPAVGDGSPDVLFEPVRTLQKALQQHPELAVVVISQEHDIYTIQSLAEIGVKGYFLKTDNFARSLGIVVEQIRDGMIYFSPDVQELILSAPPIAKNNHLTEQQMTVLRAIFRSPGVPRKELAASLHITKSTLQKHINMISDALEVPNIEACIIKAMRMGLIDLEG
jgi:DNA-binding NarL/FixJ family response regulator